MPNPNLYAIVGSKHQGAEKFVAALPADEPLMLAREPDNKYDRNAVQVWAKYDGSWRIIGYVPKTQNAILAQFIDAFGKPYVPPGDGSGARPDSAVAQMTVDAKLHKGSNTFPLAEIV